MDIRAKVKNSKPRGMPRRISKFIPGKVVSVASMPESLAHSCLYTCSTNQIAAFTHDVIHQAVNGHLMIFTMICGHC